MRREFPAKVKMAAFDRAGGSCEFCSARLYPGKFRYNHRIPDALGGEPSLENCEVLCINCDATRTYQTDIPRIAKSKRVRRVHAGIKKPRKITRWRKFNGEPVTATRNR